MQLEWMQLFLSVPIFPPSFNLKVEWENVEKGEFNWDDTHRFQIAFLDREESLLRDDLGQYYFFKSVTCRSMDEAKRWRQVQRPPYMHDVELPMINLLENRGFTPFIAGYDKAFAHLVVQVDHFTGTEGSSVQLSRWANIDGDDDPIVVKANHYLTNRYDGNITYHITGWGTYSFATVTDNKRFGEALLKPIVGNLYLQYYTYWIQHEKVPSRQMMAMLLENLWRSTTIHHSYNAALLTISPIE